MIDVLTRLREQASNALDQADIERVLVRAYLDGMRAAAEICHTHRDVYDPSDAGHYINQTAAALAKAAGVEE